MCCFLLIRDADCAVTIPDSNVFFRLKDKLYGKWLTHYQPNNDIIAFCCNEYPDQLWHIIDYDGKYFRLENKNSGWWLTASGDGDVWPYRGGKYDDSLWYIYTPSSDGIHFRLKNKYRGTVLVSAANEDVWAYSSLHGDQLYKFEYDIDWSSCQTTGYTFINNNNKFPLQAELYEAEYVNNGPIEQSTDGVLELEKCELRTVETSQETNWQVGIEAEVGFSAFGADVSVTASFSVGGSIRNTNSNSKQECSTTQLNPPTCPAHYKCARTFTISKIPETTKKVVVNLNCGGAEIDWIGEFKVAGGAQITFSDTFHPIGCFDYYSDIYTDRKHNLPFCVDCSSNNVCNKCEVGGAAPVLISLNSAEKVECINILACTQYCDGDILGDENNGYICSDPDITKDACVKHLQYNNIITKTKDYTKYVGHQCLTSRELERAYQGTANECKTRCDEFGDTCIAFVRVNDGSEFAGKCYFRSGVLLNEPYVFTKDNRDCYIKL
eukprot:8880_1